LILSGVAAYSKAASSALAEDKALSALVILAYATLYAA